MSASDVKMSGILYQCTMQNAFGMGNRNIVRVFLLPLFMFIFMAKNITTNIIRLWEA